MAKIIRIQYKINQKSSKRQPKSSRKMPKIGCFLCVFALFLPIFIVFFKAFLPQNGCFKALIHFYRIFCIDVTHCVSVSYNALIENTKKSAKKKKKLKQNIGDCVYLFVFYIIIILNKYIYYKYALIFSKLALKNKIFFQYFF